MTKKTKSSGKDPYIPEGSAAISMPSGGCNHAWEFPDGSTIKADVFLEQMYRTRKELLDIQRDIKNLPSRISWYMAGISIIGMSVIFIYDYICHIFGW